MSSDLEMKTLYLGGARVEARLTEKGAIERLQSRLPDCVDQEKFISEYIKYPTLTGASFDRVLDLIGWRHRLDLPDDRVVALLWSGGIDSTSLMGALLQNGYAVLPVYISTRREGYLIRELAAVKTIWKMVRRLLDTGFHKLGARLLAPVWYFDLVALMEDNKTSDDLVPNRNELMVNFVIDQVMRPIGISVLGAGEYIGSDSWVVDWHVPPGDCRPESFEHWLGPNRSFVYLNTFTNYAEVKSDRLELGINTLGADVMEHTTCCLSDTMLDCGLCYGCVERNVAWEMLKLHDATEYIMPPWEHWLYQCYKKQHVDAIRGR